jgi:molybdopterin synthase catalytic subunit/molybdopterin converting factor small subunit
MQVRVLLFGVLKDVTGRASEQVTLPDGATLQDLVARYQSQFPRLRELGPSLALSINQEYAAAGSRLRENDEVALLPPVSGGRSGGTATDAAAPADQKARGIALVRARIERAEIVRAFPQPEDGAVVVFEGTARSNTRGRRTLYLDYEAYEAMAQRELEKLATEARAKFTIREVAIVHRLGRIEIGETSVLIAVASAHRAAAFEACRWLIDTLKRTVPIWKKEYFVDGAVWADGEPFPAAISEGNTGA